MPRPHAKFHQNWWFGLREIGLQETEFVQF